MDNFLKQHNLKISIFFILLMYLLFHPKGYSNIDEFDYHKNAHNIVNSNLRQTCNKKDWSQIRVNIKEKKFCIYKYNLGTSFLLIPAILISDYLIFFTTLLSFILSIWIFNKLLMEFKLNPLLLYFFAWFPPFIYFSRTVLSEIYSATAILLTFYLLYKSINRKNKKLQIKKNFLICSGASIGIGVLIRYTNTIPLLIMTMGFLFNLLFNKNYEKNVQKTIKFSINIFLGGLPFLLLFLYINKYLYGGFLKTGYNFSTGDINFQLINLFKVGWKHILILSLLYPGLLFLGLFSKFKYKWLLFSSTVSLILIYSLKGFNKFELRLLDLILGMRYYIPVVPLLFLSYSAFLNKLLKFKWIQYVYKACLIALLVNLFLLNIIHNNYLKTFKCIPRSFSNREKNGCLEIKEFTDIF